MSFLGGIVNAIGGVVSDIFGGGGSSGGILSAIESFFGGGNSGLSSLFSDVTGGLKDLFSSGFGSFLSTANSVIGTIDNTVGNIAKTLSDLVSPVKTTLDNLAGLAQDIQDKLIAPITGTITTTLTSVQDLEKSLSSDLHDGLTGIMKIPGDIANTLTSVDAQFGRAIEQLGSNNSAIVKDSLIPGLGEVIGGPMGKTAENLVSDFSGMDVQAQFSDLTKLKEYLVPSSLPNGVTDVVNMINGTAGGGTTGATYQDLANAMRVAGEYGNIADLGNAMLAEVGKTISQLGGFFAPLIKGLWSLMLAGELIGADLQQYLTRVIHQANIKYPTTLIDAGDVVEAWRRKLISPEDAILELQQKGYDASRITVLHNLAQFLFSPQDAIRMNARGIIDETTLKTLFDQNNLSPAQGNALIMSMQHLLAPADIAAAYARGLIDHPTFTAMMKADMVLPAVQDLINKLEIDPVDPRSLVRILARMEQAQNGYLQGTLTAEVPQSILDAYTAAQVPPFQAQIDYAAHWEIPGPDWWVDCYFRGLVTLTQAEQAMRARNIPPELFANIIEDARELPPVWLIPDIVSTGVWPKDKALAAFKQLGFSDENAQVLYDYGYSKSKASKAQTAGDLQQISLTNAAALYDDGFVTEVQYEEILAEHGYSADAAALTVELAKFKNDQKALTTQATQIIDAVKLGVETATQAQADLYSLGLPDAAVAKYMLQLETAKVANAKLPSRAELDSMLKKGVIDKTKWADTMQLLGYSPDWIALLAQIV